MDHGRVDASFIHLPQEIVLREGGDLSVAWVRGFVIGPDMDLCIDD
jgi:hypothetical protein